jgi:hypothetical protein
MHENADIVKKSVDTDSMPRGDCAPMKTRYYISTAGLMPPFPHYATRAEALTALRAMAKDSVKACEARYGKAGLIWHSPARDGFEVRIGGKQGFNLWTASAIVAA